MGKQDWNLGMDGKAWAGQLVGISVLLLVMMWAYAALSKLWELERFVAQMQLVPFAPVMDLAPVLGWLVPLVELGIVLLLCSGRGRRLGCWCSLALLLVFEAYIGILTFSGRQLPCTCGGLISRLQWKQHLVFNAVFMLLSLLPLSMGRLKSDISPRHIYN